MSTETQERKKPGPKPKLPKVDILDRRLRNPFGTGSVPITLKTPGRWEVRYVHANVRTGRIHDMVQNKGWVFVEPSELDGTPEEYGLSEKNNRLVRGDHGQEVLMKMPSEIYQQIQRAKEAANLKGLGQKALRETAAQETAVKYGSEAGDAVFDKIRVSATKGIDEEMEAEGA